MAERRGPPQTARILRAVIFYFKTTTTVLPFLRERERRLFAPTERLRLYPLRL